LKIFREWWDEEVGAGEDWNDGREKVLREYGAEI